MCDFVALGWDLAFKYRTPAMILADGTVGQMMEKVILPEPRRRRTEEELREQCPWAVTGKKNRKRNIITSLELNAPAMEVINNNLQAKYKRIEENEVRCEALNTEDCEYLIVAFGSMARICEKAMELARKQGLKVGLLRPVTLWPFPAKAIEQAARKAKGVLVVELSAGQMIEDVKLAVNCQVDTRHYGRMGGMIPTPDEILGVLKEMFVK